MPFYRRLSEQEKNSALRAHLLVVMPNNASSGGSFLEKENLEVQAIFGQELQALNVSGTPTVLLLDSSGRVEQTWVGQLTPRMEKDVLRAAEE
jgi:hypothetical protein